MSDTFCIMPFTNIYNYFNAIKPCSDHKCKIKFKDINDY